jgi:hypothetical protein
VINNGDALTGVALLINIFMARRTYGPRKDKGKKNIQSIRAALELVKLHRVWAVLTTQT